jgi:gamma-glutamyltranspeptidase/glutathione hydrolase
MKHRFALAAVVVAFVVAFAPAGADAAKPAKAAISSAHKLATDAGFEVLAEGGNAFDAAVAVAAALSVLEPQSSGIGGGGLFLLRRASDGKEVMVDARETAPAAVDPKDYVDANGDANRDHSTIGALSAAIPGEPAGLVWIAEHYGKLPLSKSLAPAIRIAKDGYEPDSRFLGELARRKDAIKRFPGSAALYLVNGEVPPEGWVFKTPDLARVLEALAAHGRDSFYRGDFAKKLVDGVRAEGGRWTLDDLASYEVKEREPLSSTYKGYRMVTAPPPSSGGIAIAEILNILSGYDLSKLDHAHQVHLAVEAMRRAYRDRAEYLGDPDFVEMPIRLLMSPDYAAGLRASIHPEKATPSDLLPGYLDTQQGLSTSHFSIIDTDGNLVSATQTVNLIFGSAFVVPGTGFVLNDEMDDFALVAGKPNAYGLVGNDRNAPKPRSRPLSSMSPSFVDGPDRLAVLGTPGGSVIITMTLEGILAFVDGQEPAQFVANRRYHHQYLPDVISAEKNALSGEDIATLKAMGHEITEAPGTWPYGFMNAVSWNKKTGEMRAAADPRGVSGSGQVR